MKKRETILIGALALLMIVMTGCSDSTTPPPPTAEELVTEGWSAFESGDFNMAISKFEDAVEAEPTLGDAYNGLGWCWMNLDSLEAGRSSFEQAYSQDFLPYPADPNAGLAIITRDLEPVDLETSMNWAREALTLDSVYVFVHDTTLNWKDLRLIQVQCYFSLGEYELANALLPGIGGQSQNPESEDFIEDLLQEIERLGMVLSDASGAGCCTA